MPSDNTLRAVAGGADLPPHDPPPVSASAIARHLSDVFSGFLDSALREEGFPWHTGEKKKEFILRFQTLVANAVSGPDEAQGYEIEDGLSTAADQNEPAQTADASMSDSAQDGTDAKIAAAEARTDAKLAGFQGQFQVLTVQLEHIASSIREQRTEVAASRTAVITTVFGVGAALAALLWAAITYGDSVFGRGMVVRDVVDTAVHDAIKQLPPKSP